ncbi:hypothetical protein SDC9_69357 [bioreactor metagenome]|uniref:Peptidase M50 domain-containing protein n=1 Tax=bioreactor metagenome TaxID=1076179 RepID=A0A644Y411_9ZZZZ
MKKHQTIVLSALGSAFLSIFIYIVLHESGHCLIAALGGAKITEFSILGAHMRYEGGAFSAATLSLLNAAGVLLPVLVSAVYMFFYSQARSGVFYRIFSFMFSMIPFFALIAWIFVPILYLSGNAPTGDDVTMFLYNSGVTPLIVSLSAAALLALGIALATKKRIIQNYWETCRSKTVDTESK